MQWHDDPDVVDTLDLIMTDLATRIGDLMGSLSPYMDETEVWATVCLVAEAIEVYSEKRTNGFDPQAAAIMTVTETISTPLGQILMKKGVQRGFMSE